MCQCLTNRATLLLSLIALTAIFIISSPAFAAKNSTATATSQSMTDALVQQAIAEMQAQSAASNASAASGAAANPATAAAAALAAATGQEAAPAPVVVNAADLEDPDSALFKANALAKQRKLDKTLDKAAGVLEADQIIGGLQTPPEMGDLQNINSGKAAKDALNSADSGFLEGDMAKDMRKEAQRNAALSYGARGGLSKRSYEIMEKMDDYANVLDKVFDFRSLLIKAPSGMLVEPPIIKESLEAMVITPGGNEAAMADTVLDINKNAKIVSAPRDWRQYLIQSWTSKVPPPPKILWPQNAQEQADWNGWIAQGWEAGIAQAEQIFELNTNRLASDYRGMVRYRILLAQGMVSAPYTTQEERGVVGDKNQMRIGDRAIRITEPSRFLTGANIWRPADR